MAVVLNGVDQGINAGLSSSILSAAGSLFVYYEVIASRSFDEDYVGLGMRSDSTRAVEIVGVASGVTFQVLVSGGSPLAAQGTGNLKDNTLHRVFIGWSQESGRRFAYVDGVQASQSAASFPSPDNPASGLNTLGYRPWSGDERWLQGQLSNVAVWTGSANFGGTSATENAAAIALTSGVSTPNNYATYAAYWPLDYDARDLGPNGLDGTLVGSPTFTGTAPRWYKGNGAALRPYLKTSGGLVELQ